MICIVVRILLTCREFSHADRIERGSQSEFYELAVNTSLCFMSQTTSGELSLPSLVPFKLPNSMSFNAHPFAVLFPVWAACCALGCEDKKPSPSDQPKAGTPLPEISEIVKEKESRTAAQKKLDSHVVLALKKSRGEPPFDKESKHNHTSPNP